MRFYKIKEMLKISDFYLDKQKSFIPKEILSVTPPIPEIIWVKNVRAIVVCGFVMK